MNIFDVLGITTACTLSGRNLWADQSERPMFPGYILFVPCQPVPSVCGLCC